MIRFLIGHNEFPLSGRVRKLVYELLILIFLKFCHSSITTYSSLLLSIKTETCKGFQLTNTWSYTCRCRTDHDEYESIGHIVGTWSLVDRWHTSHSCRLHSIFTPRFPPPLHANLGLERKDNQYIIIQQSFSSSFSHIAKKEKY